MPLTFAGQEKANKKTSVINLLFTLSLQRYEEKSFVCTNYVL
jgi:hypothetical protein